MTKAQAITNRNNYDQMKNEPDFEDLLTKSRQLTLLCNINIKISMVLCFLRHFNFLNVHQYYYL